MKRACIFFLLLSVLAVTITRAQDIRFVNDVETPVINLNGTWKICLNPPERHWEGALNTLPWHDILVPGEVMMQGYPIRHDTPFLYRKDIHIPLDYEGKLIKVRFEGVYSYARVWVNGQYIRDHHGGFTTWDCDISEAVTPGETAILTVEVTDRSDEISYASGYAKHQIGGILRDVHLLGIPRDYVEDFTVQTDLDDHYENANLMLSGKIPSPSPGSVIMLKLLDMKGQEVPLDRSSIAVNTAGSFYLVNHVNHPEKWDAEHPNLYHLILSLQNRDTIQWSLSCDVGFREVKVAGNKLLVNGRAVKLRGANRHDIHPLLGRVSIPEYELKDVLLAKEANLNFIRTSHYPPTDNFLSLCDKYGLYVEDETAVCFVGSHRTKEYRPGNSENDPEYTDRYLSQLSEMVNSHKNHPSVIIWSIGNENEYGTNFKASFDWVKANDTTRPVIFSYPGKVSENTEAYEIISMHYPDITGNMNQYGFTTQDFSHSEMPVLFDEWAHVACYNNFTVKEDPNIRDFWGKSLDLMWHRTFEADGGLGGAIWGMIDETFMLPDSLPGFNAWWGKIDKNVIPAEYAGNTVGYGEWGILDTWRRKKPEFWNTKKAYSPVKLLKTEIDAFTPGQPVTLPLYNRFDHTNIDELVIKLHCGDEILTLESPSIGPHEKGHLVFTPPECDAIIPLILEFFDPQDLLIDVYSIQTKTKTPLEEDLSVTGRIHVAESDKQLLIQLENGTTVTINTETGLFQSILTPSDTILISGPFINLRLKGKPVMYSYHQINDYGQNWQLLNFRFSTKGNTVTLHSTGKYDSLAQVDLKIQIHANGQIITEYEIKEMPSEDIREIGIRFELADEYDALEWTRQGYWSHYPDNHLSALKGSVPLYPEKLKLYRSAPDKSWNLDTKSFYYDGNKDESYEDRFTNSARATKENIKRYSLQKNNRQFFSAISHGGASCRIAKTEDTIQWFINNAMDYIDLSWGNYQRNFQIDGKYRNQLELLIH